MDIEYFTKVPTGDINDDVLSETVDGCDKNYQLKQSIERLIVVTFESIEKQNNGIQKTWEYRY